MIHDAAGNLRVVYRTPGWDDFVQLSCREIRVYGAANFQVARLVPSQVARDAGQICLNQGQRDIRTLVRLEPEG